MYDIPTYPHSDIVQIKLILQMLEIFLEVILEVECIYTDYNTQQAPNKFDEAAYIHGDVPQAPVLFPIIRSLNQTLHELLETPVIFFFIRMK